MTYFRAASERGRGWRHEAVEATCSLGPEVFTAVFTTGLKDLMMENISVKAECQESVTFENVALYFTEQELASLRLDQKALYKDVVLENFAHMAFLGYLSKLRKYTQLLGAEASRVKAIF